MHPICLFNRLFHLLSIKAGGCKVSSNFFVLFKPGTRAVIDTFSLYAEPINQCMQRMIEFEHF